jgi:hypothetical protein
MLRRLQVTVLFHTTAKWTGFPGAPGYTNMYAETSDPLSTGAQAHADNVRAFFDSVKGFFYSAVNIQVQAVVETIDDTNGDLLDAITVGTPPAVVVGTSGSQYAGPAGACITWKTAGIVNSRHVRGRTFLVPMAVNQYDSDGTLTSGALSILIASASAYRTASGPVPVVWHRPTGPGATDGSSFAITASSVTDKVAYLSSRRD